MPPSTTIPITSPSASTDRSFTQLLMQGSTTKWRLMDGGWGRGWWIVVVEKGGRGASGGGGVGGEVGVGKREGWGGRVGVWVWGGGAGVGGCKSEVD